MREHWTNFSPAWGSASRETTQLTQMDTLCTRGIAPAVGRPPSTDGHMERKNSGALR
ncbi:FYVE RhoGEF and PH domain-containing protein 1, partial [Biomphalaria glabrata]